MTTKIGPRPLERTAEESAPLSPALGHAARRELTGGPIAELNADDLSGPDDLRLRKIKRAAARENEVLVSRLTQEAKANGFDADVYGRAKTTFSTFNKLRETPGSKLGDIKDLSGARVDVADVYEAKDALGGEMKLKADYISKPNKWGYTGRVHGTIESPTGLVHELQFGSKDISNFIDGKLTTKGGDRISLHDATGYKGKIHGVELPKALEAQYPELMKRISDANQAGKTVEEIPQLARDVAAYKRSVEVSLPAKLAKPPAPELSTMARIGKGATIGLGALGVVGGVLQTRDGIDRIGKGGDKIEGGADVAAGSGSVVAGTAMIGGRLVLGTATGGAVAVVDGAKDIYTGVRDANAEKIAVGTVKAGAGTAMIAGVATANPLLIAGGAIAYGGAVVYEHRAAIANFFK